MTTGGEGDRAAPALSPQRCLLQPRDAPASVVEYLLPTPHSVPGRLAAAADGSVWFAETAGDRIVHMTAAGLIREFPLPADDCRPDGARIGPDGAVWFYEGNALSVDRLDPDGHLVRFAVPACGPGRQSCQPSSIALGGDGRVWFAEHPDHWLGTIRPDGVMTEVPVPASHARPCTLCSHPDGSLWFADCAGAQIGRLSPGGALSSFRRPGHDPGQVSAMTPAAGGVAYVDADRGLIGRLTETGAFTEADHPCLGGATDICAGPLRSLWVAAPGANTVVGFMPDGSAFEIALPTPSSHPSSLVIAADGGLWVAEAAANKVARVPPALGERHLRRGAQETADVVRGRRRSRPAPAAGRDVHDEPAAPGRAGPAGISITRAE